MLVPQALNPCNVHVYSLPRTCEFYRCFDVSELFFAQYLCSKFRNNERFKSYDSIISNCNFKSIVYTARFPGHEAPVRIRVRIDPPHSLVCRKRRLNGAVLRMRPEKPRLRVTAGVAR
jgi:hypothetical protein